jgi:hypothetical protein
MELFHLSLVHTPTIPNVPKPISHIIEPLSVLPYSLGILQTYRDSSPVNDHESDLDIRDDPLCIHEGLSSLNHKCRYPIPFVFVILAIFKT